jgi:hypothetical protein
MNTEPEETSAPNVEAVKHQHRIYSLDQERRIIRDLYSKVYRVLTGELDEEGNVPDLDLEGPNPWGLFELQVVSLLMKKPRNECREDLLEIKRHCIQVGTTFMDAVKNKSIIRFVGTDKELGDIALRKQSRADLIASGKLKTRNSVDISETPVE